MSKLVKALMKSKSLVKPSRPQEREESASDSETDISVIAEDLALLEPESDSRELQVIEEPWLRSVPELSERRILHAGNNIPGVEKAFRELRTSLIEKTQGKNSTILICSITDDGGSSFVAINLAVAFAFDRRRRVGVIDCHLQNPTEYSSLLDEDVNGLTDFVENPECGIEAVFHTCGIPRVRICPPGKHLESQRDYFTDKRMQKLLVDSKRRNRENYFFVDAPSAAHSAGTRALAKVCDYVLLVANYGSATTRQLERALSNLPREKMLGICFNNDLSVK